MDPLTKHRPALDQSASLCGFCQTMRTGLEDEPPLAPHAVSAIQIAPSTSMNAPTGRLTLVPALIMSLDPSETVTSPLRFIVPVHVSVPVIVPEVVSFTAVAEGREIKPAMLESKRSATNDRLFRDVCFDITGTTALAHSHERYNTAPLLPI